MGSLRDAIGHSAAPEAVTAAVERLVETHAGLRERLEGDERVRAAVVVVCGASRSLTDLCASDATALDVLSDLGDRRPVDDADVEHLRRWKRLELLRIAARDLLGLDGLEDVGGALSRMAADVLDASCRIVDAGPLAVIGMGKLGGAELNYASDVDVLFVGSDESAARRVIDVARRCFRVDADLRPEGRAGPLTRTIESYEAYWDRWAEAWEFQALLKARAVAGDAATGATFVTAASRRVWERPFTADDLRAVRSMKARAEHETSRRGVAEREVKLGRGGIRDIEFAVQLLQLVHGRTDPDVRMPSTLEALAELGSAGYVDPADANALDEAYRFLRAVEHRLQLLDEQQVHVVPTDVESRQRLARVIGYRDTPEATAIEQFDEELAQRQAVVRPIHERLFFRPLLEAFAGAGSALPPAAAEARLAAFGFADATRTRQALRELTRGLTRSSRLMQQLLPLLLEWLSETPDPDLGLLGLRTLASGGPRTTELVTAFRDSPEAARRLCVLLGTSPVLGDTLQHNPDLVPALGEPGALVRRDRGTLDQSARHVLDVRASPAEHARGLQRLKRREELAVAARDVLGVDSVEETGSALTDLAEAVLESALAASRPPVPFAVVAMGRFGGGELSYASDLDVLFVYDGPGPPEFEIAERSAEALLAFVNGKTGALRLYELDPDLRPEGKQGPLARSLDGYRTYYERWADVWELQALVRARPVAGDLALGARFLEVVEPFVWRAPFPDERAREIRRMKARVERERIPAGDDPQFHLKLGRGSLSDIEWTAQLLQLQQGIHATGTIAALDALQTAGALSADDASVLTESYRFCERTRNRLFLIRGEPADSLPQGDQLTRLARSLDTDAGELREAYRRVTRRARQVVERLFYGKAP